MFSPRPSFPRTPVSSRKAQRPFTSSSRRSAYRSSGNLRSPFTPGLNTSRNQSLSCSFQSSVLEQTSQHLVETYGAPLPVLVTEAITSAERGIEISVRISKSGWAWLVCGRMLFVWNYKQDLGTRNTMAYCRELTLPPSDLAHKAELVYILVCKESQMPSALAVSPEGIVRYWPSISHEGASVETAADLQGQECFSLTNIQPLGCILATTTSSLVLILPFSADGQNTVICRTLRVPQGVLAGIGRRVSSFIFGAMPNQSSESKQLIKVLAEDCDDDDEKHLYVLGGNSLQKWYITDDEPDRLLYDCDIDTYVKEGFLDALWSQDGTQIHQLKTWCMDMQLSSNGIMIFVAGMNPQISQQLFYAFGILDTSGPGTPTAFSSFLVIKLTMYYTECDEEKLLSYKFLPPSSKSHLAYIYNSSTVHCISVVNAGEEPDTIDFSSHGNKILGAGTSNGLPLFFGQNYGIVALISTQAPPADTSGIMNKTIPMEASTPDSVEAPKTKDQKARLKSAMILFCKHDLVQSQNIVDDLVFQATVPSSTGDSTLDSAIATVSIELIDDHPAADPRWMDSVPPRESVSSSVIIFHQLNDKMKAQEFFLNFLKSTGLWDKMTVLHINDTIVPTKFVLYEHAEKVVAAKAMRSLHSQYNSLLDTVIKMVLKKRNISLSGHLTHQDIFYREVSKVESLFPALLEWEEQQLCGDSTAHDILAIVGSVNCIFLGVLQEVCHFRQGKDKPSAGSGDSFANEYIPWTANDGATGIRSLLIKQHGITVEHATNTTSDIQSQGTFFQYLVDLADIVLDSYKCQLESIRNKEDRYEALQAKYHQDRHDLIVPLLQAEQYERAAALAEKYCDFEILVQLCEETDNQERQQRYMIQFADQGFSDFLFKWYLDKGKRGKLLNQPPSHQSDLSRFLHGHEALSWLHYLHTGQYNLAQQTLKELALREQNYFEKKKTLLSLSKLASLASDVSPNIKNAQLEALNMEQDLILHQETLPEAVIEAYGFDPDNMRVLTPQELIEAYISEENVSANHFDFKKALDLLNCIKKPPSDAEVEALRLHIWCKALLRDSWEDMDTDDPVDSVKNTIFFRIIEMAYDQGMDLHDFLPPVDALLKCPELVSLSESPSFPFLIQAGYEHILKIL